MSRIDIRCVSNWGQGGIERFALVSPPGDELSGL